MRLFVLLTFFVLNLRSATYQEVVLSKFKACAPQKEVLYLTKEQKKNVLEKSKTDELGSVLIRYKLNCKKKSHVYVDSHIVRTMNETVLIHVEEDKVKSIDVVNFQEPMEYYPADKWLKQFYAKELSDKLALKNGVDAISGATLTSSAIVNTVRNTLALDTVMSDGESRKKTR